MVLRLGHKRKAYWILDSHFLILPRFRLVRVSVRRASESAMRNTSLKKEEGYFDFLNSIVGRQKESCLARSLSVVPLTIHSPFVFDGRCMHLFVVSSRL